jgi:hypothetical protein
MGFADKSELFHKEEQRERNHPTQRSTLATCATDYSDYRVMDPTYARILELQLRMKLTITD